MIDRLIFFVIPLEDLNSSILSCHLWLDYLRLDQHLHLSIDSKAIEHHSCPSDKRSWHTCIYILLLTFVTWSFNLFMPAFSLSSQPLFNQVKAKRNSLRFLHICWSLLASVYVDPPNIFDCCCESQKFKLTKKKKRLFFFPSFWSCDFFSKLFIAYPSFQIFSFPNLFNLRAGLKPQISHPSVLSKLQVPDFGAEPR